MIPALEKFNVKVRFDGIKGMTKNCEKNTKKCRFKI